MRKQACWFCVGWVLVGCLPQAGWAAETETFKEFEVKRAGPFEFSEKPAVQVEGDRISISFTLKANSDVTVAIENAEGRIVRHLASGVLGPHAPQPFKKNALKQTLVWDGKDDQGRYVKEKRDHVVRVSVGLKPVFERTLFWSPHKRIGKNNSPLMQAAPEGVYVFEGCGIDSLRLFKHDGTYSQTLYPFSAEKLKKVQGLDWRVFPQDGQRLPLKFGPKHKSTLLTSGDNMSPSPGKYGWAANAMAVQGARIALAGNKLSRMSTDGTTGGLTLAGPQTAIKHPFKNGFKSVQPRNVALSPDGKWLYSTGYRYVPGHPKTNEWFPCVMRMAYEGKEDASLFLGSLKFKEVGSGNTQFKVPLSVACDSKGRVYVADYMNDRIQVFTEEGKFVKSVKVKKPVQVAVHPENGEIYVASWMVVNRYIPSDKEKIPAVFSRLGPLDHPNVLASCALPFTGYNPTISWNRTGGLHYRVSFDLFAKKSTLWVIPGLTYKIGGWGVHENLSSLKGTGLLLLQEEGKKLVIKRDFHVDTVKKVVRSSPPVISRQRLYVHPVKGTLYVGEGDSGVMKSFRDLVAIDPDTGRIKVERLPMTAEDLAIDLDGNFYLRDDYHVARFDPETWREIPFDYGEERKSIGFDAGMGSTAVVSTLVLPSTGRYGWWHLGGMAVNAKGNLAITCSNRAKNADRREQGENFYAKRGGGASGKGQAYVPTIFPGRVRGWEVHIWDKHGKVLYQDALPGIRETDGIGLDKDDNLYLLANPNRMLNGKPYFLQWASTLVKASPGKAKYVSVSKRATVNLPPEARPKRPKDVADGWIEGAEWLYGGVGFAGWRSGSSCICWNARPALDLFARSFAPEVDHYSVAVLDTNGNLITRVGRFGNVDDGKPLVLAGGPAKPRSIGGDEVALFHAAYVGTHSDRRLFIADAGNNRILSVKLDYHENARISLKDKE